MRLIITNSEGTYAKDFPVPGDTDFPRLVRVLSRFMRLLEVEGFFKAIPINQARGEEPGGGVPSSPGGAERD